MPARSEGGLSGEADRQSHVMRGSHGCDCLPPRYRSAHAYDWLQFGGDARHSATNTFETALTHANVNSLAPKYQVTLPASVDGSPVYLEAVATSTGVKDLLFMTTTVGHIIALNATTGAQAWSHQYGAGSCRINNSAGPCYTTSSPAIDPNRQYVYSYGLDGYVHKYQVNDGTEIASGGWPELATNKGFDEKGSSALSFATSGSTSYLYVAHGGYPGDQGDYQGHLTAIDLATGLQKVFNTACSDQAVHFQSTTVSGAAPTCGARQDAIWSRPGVIYDASMDRIFVATGNAFNGTPGQFDGNNNWSESVIALHPDGSGGAGPIAGKPLDSYTPANHVSLDINDADVGSTAPAILPVPPTSLVQHLALQAGKDGKLRLLNLANLGSQGAPGHTGGEVASIINVPQGGAVLSQPAVWTNPGDGSAWVFIVNGSGASALRLGVDSAGMPSLVLQWSVAQGGTSPIVANGMVFYIDGGTVRAVDAVSGGQLWSVANSGGVHWQSLIIANATLYVTDGAGHLTAFGLPATSSTTTVLASSSNPALYGAGTTFAATVTGSAPTGSVSFSDGGSVITGCAAVAVGGNGNARTAACSTSALAIGSHSIVATYSGDTGNAGSSSAALTQTISAPANIALLVDHYYQAILSRAADPTGEAFWEGEAVRMQALGVDVKEAYMVMGGYFFTGAEYLSRNTSDVQYVTDLYYTFFNRPPDTGGLSYWTGAARCRHAAQHRPLRLLVRAGVQHLHDQLVRQHQQSRRGLRRRRLLSRHPEPAA